MRIKTPLGLFSAIVGVGLVPAFGVGGFIGVSLKDYDPIPAPSASHEAYTDMGASPYPVPTLRPKSKAPKTPNTDTQRRVEFDEPKERTPNRVKPSTVKVYKTPHVVVVTPEETEEPEPTVEPTPRPTVPPAIPNVPAVQPTGEPRGPKPTAEPKNS